MPHVDALATEVQEKLLDKLADRYTPVIRQKAEQMIDEFGWGLAVSMAGTIYNVLLLAAQTPEDKLLASRSVAAVQMVYEKHRRK
jgi:hypothetical protein